MRKMMIVSMLLMFTAFGAEEKDNPINDPAGYNKEKGWHLKDDKPCLYQIGDLGITIELKLNDTYCKIVDIVTGGVAHKAGARKGDMVTKIDGNDVTPYKVKPLNWEGHSALKDFAVAIHEKQAFSFVVDRDGKSSTIKVDVGKDFERYSRTLNVCKRSFKEMVKMLEYCGRNASPDGMLNGNGNQGMISSTMFALTIMNLDEKKYMKQVHKIYDNFMKRNEVSINSNWALCYVGIFLCEYYLKFKKPAAITKIQRVVKELEKRTADNGKHGHGGYEVGYDGGGLNAITTKVYLVFVLAEACGVKVSRVKKAAVKKWLKH